MVNCWIATPHFDHLLDFGLGLGLDLGLGLGLDLGDHALLC